MLGFRMEEISELIDNINIVAKLNCVLYDKDFHILHNSKDSMCRFCSLVREDETCCHRCLASDRRGFTEALKRRGLYRYRCHMGLTETVTPILCEDVVVGFMMIGQLLCAQDEEVVRARAAEHPRAADLLLELDRMHRTTEAEIAAMNNVVEMSVSYLLMQKLIRFKETPPSVLLRQYVEEHLAEDLSVGVLCRQLNLSKSSLYLLSCEVLGKGVTDYVRERRVECAKELLAEQSLSISAVAERVGYTDTNYFTKVFKKATGCTPSEWKKKKSPENDPKY